MKIAPMGRLRISAWFVIVVGLAGVVFLLEYAVLFQTEAQVVSLPGLAGQVRGTDNRQDTPPHGAQAAITAAAAESARQLAVVVPAHAGDLDKALASLAKWPKMCHESTLNNADLVLYYAGGPEGNVDALIAGLAETGGRCFASTKLVLGNLTKKVSAGSEKREMLDIEQERERTQAWSVDSCGDSNLYFIIMVRQYLGLEAFKRVRSTEPHPRRNLRELCERDAPPRQPRLLINVLLVEV